ncbi:porin [Variovorax sp. V213]|uniref:porin n=1 Tax=Variovorax sp. V213 TaxID=3065955 RepID=UPI0034E8B6D7
MMKSLIVLAAMTVSISAFAQSAITIFGVLDVRMAHGAGSVANKTQLISSGLNASRLGFRGVEDLGDGMSASFWLESSLNVDDGTFGTTNTNNQSSGSAGGGAMVFGRRSTMSLSSNWGELRLGRDFTPQFWNLSEFDPFGTTGNGTTQTLNSTITGTTQVRASNSIGYFLPKDALKGLYGQAMYYLGENSSDVGATKNDGNGWGVRLGFSRGPFSVAAATSRTTYAAGNSRQSNVGGQWDAGVATVMAHYAWDKGVVSGVRRNAKGWLVGGLVPVGAGVIRVSYSQYAVDLSSATDRITKKWALGYEYNLSKRTALYATYAHLNNGGGATQALNGATTAANKSSRGYDLGIRHRF